MRSSLFSSLKIVAMMLATDKELHTKEKKWFFTICKNYGASFSERATLDTYLRGESTESLTTILADIKDELDRGRLLNFVQMAMRQDGVVTDVELEFFNKIQNGLEPSLTKDHLEMGHKLLKRDRDLAIWKELDRFGEVWTHKLPGYTWSAGAYNANPEVWQSLYDVLKTHRKKVMVIVALAILGWYFFARFAIR